MKAQVGYVLWYFHAYVGLGHFWGLINLNFNIFGGFQKNEYFWGYEDFVDIFWESLQNWTIFRGHFYAFKGLQGTEWGIFFGVAKISNFLGVLDIPDIFLGWTVDAGLEPTYEEKMRVTPLGKKAYK